MKKELSEAALIRAIQKRSQTGAENLYDRYAQMLFKVISCSVNNPILVELALEKTLYKTWNDIHDFDVNNSTFLIWMAGIARAESKSYAAILTKKNNSGNLGTVWPIKGSAFTDLFHRLILKSEPITVNYRSAAISNIWRSFNFNTIQL
ncbi:RNA polymerase sigma factor [Mucilaginibacter lappiensis]|uniref:RNA polymerase sigma-70 factor, ECF subfamily n=1 Tax=Mucilaginibacter lappiensis TaxID=354630 RepID=A0A841JIW8_9SPHI|nr:hypothetical protein [Mucilaginibacter lappiensis]MBB6131113.1 hypothetical protein [Mucilaginibacter lappiensis]